MVEESFSEPQNASATARRHGISNQLIFAWRKAYREGRLGGGVVCGFVLAVIIPEPLMAATASAGRLEIVTANGRRVLVDHDIDTDGLVRVVQALETFTCRDCEGINQTPASFHTTPQGFLGPNLLATILFEKYGQQMPLNRQSERYGREGIDLSVSTLTDQIGTCMSVLRPLHDLIQAHVLAAERLHGDDTTVPVLAKGRIVTGRIWTYVRDDRPFGGPAPPAVLYHASRDRTAAHAEWHLEGWACILQADSYAGYNGLYNPSRSPGAITPALCWAHSRRQFFELADIAARARRPTRSAPISPVALEAVKRIDALFAIERALNGRDETERQRVRQEQSAPLVAEMEAWMCQERSRLSRSASVSQPIDTMLKRLERFTGFLDDGRICLTNNAAERKRPASRPLRSG